VTREEAKDKIFRLVGIPALESSQDNIVDTIWLNRQGVIRFVDKIFDSFDDRTCSNCKYWHQENNSQIGYNTGMCKMSKPFCNGLGITPNDFGCNKWESKDD